MEAFLLALTREQLVAVLLGNEVRIDEVIDTLGIEIPKDIYKMLRRAELLKEIAKCESVIAPLKLELRTL